MNEKEKLLKENIKAIAELDEAIISIEEELKEFQTARSQIMTTTHKQNSEINLVTSWNNTSDNVKETLASVPPSISAIPITEMTSEKPQAHSAFCIMRILRQNIATQKAQIMKNLELNNCNKQELDDDIAKLQHMQKQYILYEKDMVYNDEAPNCTDLCLSSDEGDVGSEDFLRGILGDANSNSGESRDEREKVSTSANNNNENVIVHGHNTPYRSNSLISQSQLDIHGKSIKYLFLI